MSRCMNRKILLLVPLFLLSGCQRISLDKEFCHMAQTARDLTGGEIVYSPSAAIHESVHDQLTRNQAIAIALRNNQDLQALFESIGIAQADLEQAGLFTNPDIHGFFWPPLQRTTMELETGAFFKISDLWQMPLRKNVQRDVLEAVKAQILEAVLEVIKDTRMAYDTILFYQKQITILTDILKQVTDLRNTIYHRQDFGLSTDLEKQFADVTVSNSHIALLRAQNELSKAYLTFKQLLGITPTPAPITLIDSFDSHLDHLKKIIPPLEQVQKWALANRPEIQAARLKVKQFQDAIALERSKIVSTVNAGISFKQDFDGSRGVGPNFEFSLPIFDRNQAQIARAEFLCRQAQKELISVQINIQKEVQTNYFDFLTTEKELSLYNRQLLPSTEKALKYTETFEPVMQITMVTLLQTKTVLYQNKVKAAELVYNALNAFSKLERAAGRRLDLLSQS